MKPLIESENIRFVEVSEHLIPDYLIMVNDYENVNRFIGGNQKTFTEEQEIEWVREKLEEGAAVFSMIGKASGAFIGNIELMNLTEEEGELGIAITAKMQNRGYGTEAVRTLIHYAFSQLGLKRVVLRTRPDNERARRVYEKCGFREYKRTDEAIHMEILSTGKQEEPVRDVAGIELQPMTRERMHEFYRGFCFDPDIFMDMAVYEKCREYRYDAQKVDALFDKRLKEEDGRTFAVLLRDRVIGEIRLRHIDAGKKECELSIHLQNDSFKNQGYGTQAERLAIRYAFECLGMERVLADSIVKNTRSRHVLEKLGFVFQQEKEGFRYYCLDRKDWDSRC